MKHKKTLQVPVIVGEGKAHFFIEKDTRIAPPSPPIFTVKDIKKWVEVYTTKVIKNKVIFNAFLWKTVIYTTVEHVHDGTVNGPIYHSTFKVPFGGYVDLRPYPGERITEEARAELLEAKVEGEKDIWHDEKCIEGVKVYEKLLEKTVVSLKFKATTIQHVEVEALRPHLSEEEDSQPDDCESSALIEETELDEDE